MAAAHTSFRLDPDTALAGATPSEKVKRLPEISGVSRGRDLTRKDRRIASGLPAIDNLLGGGIVRGRISEFCGNVGAGKTSLAMRFAAQVTSNEAAAWIESSDNLDPASMLAAGIEPARMLWVSCREAKLSHRSYGVSSEDNSAAGSAPMTERGWRHQVPIAGLKAAEWIMAAGGFGLVVLDFAASIRFLPSSVALRLARAAERSGTAVIVLGERQMCGTFAALGLTLKPHRPCFNRTKPGSPATFDGQLLEVQVIRNKLGGSGRAIVWPVAVDPAGALAVSSVEQASPSEFANLFDSGIPRARQTRARE